MKHRAFAPALGALAAIFVAAGVPSYASAADPSGIWAKEDGSAKMEVKKCGRGICSKIVWLRSPEDSRGRPLRDARNENTSMRDRPIMGLPLFINMVAIDSSSWQGSVYNPEEGKIYNDVKVTLASRNQIVLKGCKAWLLCGEKMWTRSKLPPSVVKPEEQEPIEVKAPAPVEPDEPAAPTAPAAQKTIEAKAPVVPEEPAPKAMPTPAPVIEAAREPVAEPKAIATAPLTVGTPPAAAPVEARVSVAPKRIVKSPNSAQQHNNVGLGLVTTATSPDPLPLSGDNVSSMIVMTSPAAGTEATEPEVTEENVQSAAIEEEQAPPAPAPKPKAKPSTQSAEAAGPVSAAPRVVKPKPKPKEPEEVLPWLRPR
jgi:uncharacterized protein (DUF2147 family)